MDFVFPCDSVCRGLTRAIVRLEYQWALIYRAPKNPISLESWEKIKVHRPNEQHRMHWIFTHWCLSVGALPGPLWARRHWVWLYVDMCDVCLPMWWLRQLYLRPNSPLISICITDSGLSPYVQWEICSSSGFWNNLHNWIMTYTSLTARAPYSWITQITILFYMDICHIRMTK